MLRTALLSAAAMLMLSMPVTAQAQHHEDPEAATSQPSASIPMTESQDALAQDNQAQDAPAQEEEADELAQNAPPSSEEPTPYGLQGHLDAEGNHIAPSIPADDNEQLAMPNDLESDQPDVLAQTTPLTDEETPLGAQGKLDDDGFQTTEPGPASPTPENQQ